MDRDQQAQREKLERTGRFGWMSEMAWADLSRFPAGNGLWKWLEQSGGDGRHGRLLLHAIHSRCIHLVKSQLGAGASARAQPYDESDKGREHFWSPLCMAVSASEYPYDPALFDLLVEAGGDRLERPAVSLVRNHSVVAAAIDDPVALADMLSRGMDPDLVSNPAHDRLGREQYTALQFAAQNAFDKHTPRWRRRRVVRQLVEAGADMDLIDTRGRCVLGMALERAPYLVGVLLGARASEADPRALIEPLRDQGQDVLHASLSRRLAGMERQAMEAGTARVDGVASKPRL